VRIGYKVLIAFTRKANRHCISILLSFVLLILLCNLFYSVYTLVRAGSLPGICLALTPDLHFKTGSSIQKLTAFIMHSMESVRSRQMTHKNFAHKHLRHVMAFFITCCVALISPLTYAVTKHISLTGANGQALANTTITIKFPDGTTKEEDTDDRGILIFDFSSNGKYKLLDPGGKVIQTVSISGAAGASGVAAGAVAATAGVVVIGAVAASQSTGGSGNSSGSGMMADPSGTYALTFSVASNPASHPDLLTGQSININLSYGSGSLVISQTTSVPNYTDTSGSLSGTNISTSGSGSYAGFSGIQAQLNVTYNASMGTFSGTYSQGTAGGLPTGQAITWNLNGI